MTTTGESAPSESLIKDAGAIGWLVVIWANVGVGVWILSRTALPEPPLLLAFVVFFIAALVLFVMQDGRELQRPEASSLVADESHTPRRVARIRRVFSVSSRWRLALFLLAVMAAAYTLWRLPGMEPAESYSIPFLMWAFSIAGYSIAWAPLRRSRFASLSRKVKAAWSEHRTALLLLLNILLVALLLRASLLESIPYTLGGDEASQGLEAVRVLQGEIRNPFTTGWLGVPTLSFFFNSLTIDWLGMTKTGLRLPWALTGTLTVAAAFFLVRRLQGLVLAVATTALLAVYHYHIHFSRLGSNQIADPLFVAVSFYFLVRALQEQDRLAWILTGVVSGLALYFYAGARFTPVVVLAVLALSITRQPRNFLRLQWRGIAIMAGAFLVTAAPIMQFAARFPDDFNARLNQVGIIQSGWLQRELQAGNELLPTLWDQFRRAALAFNYYPDRTVWYGLTEPLLDPIFGGVFVVGLLYATLLVVVRNEQRVMPFVVWWWGGMLAGGMLTESAPSSQRLTTLTIPTCFFITFALWHTITLAGRGIRDLPERLVLALCVIAFAITSVNLYFFEFTPQHRYGGRHAELATSLAPLFDAYEQTHDAYFLGAPWMYWGFATIPYLSPNMPGQDLEQPLNGPLPSGLLRPGRGAIFIVRPERAAELPYVQESFPNGHLFELRSRAPDRELLATLYFVPPDSLH